MFLIFFVSFSAGETQEECNKCGKVYMAPETDKGRGGACPECSPSSRLPPTDAAASAAAGSSPPDEERSYGGDSEDCSSMGSADDCSSRGGVWTAAAADGWRRDVGGGPSPRATV